MAKKEKIPSPLTGEGEGGGEREFANSRPISAVPAQERTHEHP